MNKCLNCGIETNNKKFCSISCQNKLQNSEKANNKFGLLKEFTVKCKNCEKEFIVKEREKLFPKKETYFCSRGCANKRILSDETKEKIKKTLIKNNTIKILCKQCNKEFEVPYRKKAQLFCSRNCNALWRNLNKGLAHKAGIASVVSQSKRSKNEIYFAELCKKYFNNVLTNEPIFNGWDADIIIENIKIVVFWNGKWHYEKIKKNHSVKQVQNRERIKIKEIKKKGYEVYIIKDMGKYNKKFVEREFEKFIFLYYHPNII